LYGKFKNVLIMEKFIGMLKSEISGITYPIWWDSIEKTVWRDAILDAREMIGYSAPTDEHALNAARKYLATQI
jgi:hypothetical protein